MNDQINYGGENYQIIAGENNTNIVNVTEVPVPIVGIPQNLPRHAKAFVGRSQELAQLHEQLQQSNQLAITAISGMGGIGKTELALQYALHHLEQKTYKGGVCWLQARGSNVGTQIVKFARIKLGLKLPEGLDLDDQISWCWQHWHEGTVLLILDDVTNYDKPIPDNVTDYDESPIQPYLPSASRFKVLLTTRLRLGQAFETLNLDVLSETAALDLLRSFTDSDRINSQLEAAKQLCQWLGFLPLGLELVGRYLGQKPDLLLQNMLNRLEKRRLQQGAMVRDPNDPAWMLTAKHGVAAAFELSWQELNADAQELCYLLSFFSLDPITWKWVEQCFPDRDPEDIEDLRDQQLIRLSLLQRSGEHTYLLHQLIREFFQAKSIAVENSRQVDELKRSICRVMTKIARTVPETPTLAETAELTPAIPHLESVAQHLTEFYSDEDLCSALTRVAWFYEGQSQYLQAERWYINCQELMSKRFGDRHPDVASSFNNLALFYKNKGQYDVAECLYQQALEMYRRLLGEENSDVALSLNNLGALCHHQQRYEKAEPLYRQALSIYERLFGKEHLDVARTLNNLAGLYNNQQRYEEAEPLYKQTLEIYKQLLGETHPAIALGLNNLGTLYNNQKCYERAELLYNQALRMYERLFGKEHLNVAHTLNNLAGLYNNQRRYEEAEPLYKQALTIYKQLLGETHPAIAFGFSNLGTLYNNQQRYDETESFYRQALEMYEWLWGKKHPDVARSLNNLAEFYKNQRRYEEAEPLYKQALIICKRLLGKEHPDVAIGLNNLAKLYNTLGRYKRAEPLYRKALGIYERLFGKEHLDVARSLNNLAEFYSNQCRYEEAKPLYKQALAIYEQLLGKEHPNAVEVRSNLEWLRWVQRER